jgi:predicted O-methyltransferase YrrM
MVHEQTIGQLCGATTIDDAVLTGLPSQDAELVALAKLAAHFGSGNVLEVGTSKGRTACAIRAALGAKAKFKTLDVRACGEEFKTRFPQHEADAIQISSLEFDWKKESPYDLIHINGEHKYTALMSDTSNALDTAAKGGIILWHNYKKDPASKLTCWIDFLGRFIDIVHIQGTHFAMHRKS